MTPLPQQPPTPPTASPYITPESKEKGDAGIYAALDAMHNAVRLGMEPVSYRQGTLADVQAVYNAAVVEAVQAASGDAAAEAVERGVGGAAVTATAVGLPDDVATLRSALPLVHELKPRDPLNFDALQRLFALMEEAVGAAEAAEGVGSGGITALLLSNGVVDPARQPSPSTEAWEAKYREVYARYTLPVAHAAASSAGSHNFDEEDDDTQREVDAQNNADLQELCEKLGITYETHAKAVRDVAFYEMSVFPLLCAYLSRINEPTAGGRDAATVAAVACSRVRVLDLSYNNIGAPVVSTAPGEDGGRGDVAPVRQLSPLRALAAMLDANESLRYLNLRANALGPRGVGIIAKALTKNIALCGIDLSANALNVAADTEEVEDPLYEPEDPVFGESYEGLEALAEVLKKNKFLRAPHLGLSFADAQEQWQSIPLWTLISPLYRYQRLRALDLSKNLLGNDGVRMLAVALSHNTSVEVLDLTDNAIGYAGLGHLARYVLGRNVAVGAASAAAAPQSALHTLILRQNPLACVGGAADAASGVDARRRRLTKRQQKSALAAVRRFASALEGPRGLRRLVMANTYLGPTFSSILLRSLARAEALEELDFAYNHACGDYPSNFDGTAAQELAGLLYQLQRHGPPRLQCVCFDGNNLTAAGVAALIPPEVHVAFPQTLHKLTLGRNTLGDDLGSLSQLLAAGATAITHLDISYNNISTVASLLPGLATATSLRELNMSHNNLGLQEGLLRGITPAQQEMEVAQLFQGLAQLPNLEVLDISHNDWRATHIEQLSAFFSNTTLATALRKLDVRNTPHVPTAQLMTLLQYVASRPTMEVFMATVVPDKTEGVDAEAADANSTVAPWTFDSVLQVIHGVVVNSSSLLEVDCGLLQSDAGAASSSDDASVSSAALDEARERLLLNVLMKAATSST
ncbi:Leucine Rich repeat family protein [Leishmania donovani]|uniref:Leucine Rich repeat family protein n=1 Tax=Leishmania donovani TaxID=5661 RepID=A0A504WYT6_LEIDO|nr:Leucine Rich repeat family protein [Leishmania donovani]